MSLAKKLLSPLRNAFSYAVHMESADDYDRKPEAAAKVLAASLPAPEGTDDGYENRLHNVLLKTRTRALDTLTAKNVRVVLDARLSHQRLEAGDRRIDGIFYDAPDAKTVAVWDDGTQKKTNWIMETPAYHAPTMLEKLAQNLDAGATGDMYASRYTFVDAAPGIGIAGLVTVTNWTASAEFEPGAAQKNPALLEPLKKPAAPKP